MSRFENYNCVIKKHVDFWNHSPVREPLVVQMPFTGWKLKPYPLSGGREVIKPKQIAPADIDIDRLLGLDIQTPPAITDNIINCIAPVYPESWMEAVIGCPVYASAFSCTAKPVVTDIMTSTVEFSLETVLKSDWLKIMDEVLFRAIDVAEGRIAVRQLHLRGAIDMLAAYLGEEQLCLLFYDHPEIIEQLADNFADLYITIAKRGLKIRPPWNGGYVSGWGIFAPGPLVEYQIDASNMLSPPLYEKHLLKYDKRIISEFPYSLIHMHRCALHMLDAVLQIDKLKTVEISLDRETIGWDKEKILQSVKKIQDSGKAALIYGELNENELAELKDQLNPRGLAIFSWCPVE